MTRAAILVTLLALQGCATCERHRPICNAVFIGASAALIVGLGASEWHGGGCVAGCTRPIPDPRHQ